MLMATQRNVNGDFVYQGNECMRKQKEREEDEKPQTVQRRRCAEGK